MTVLRNKKILVTGLSGTGKTYISAGLIKLGVNAYDADEVDRLAGWFDKSGNHVEFPDNASTEWLANHDWIWDQTFLQEWLSRMNEVILFGISSNWHECLGLFDHVFFLTLNETELRKRLQSEDRANPFGKTLEQENRVINNIKNFERFALSFNAIPIDSSKTPEEILDFINKIIG